MVKERNIAVCIILSLITCGIYSIYWMVVLTDELNELSGEDGTSGILALVLTMVTCGLYGFYWAYKIGEKVETCKENRGIVTSNTGLLYLIVFFLSPIIIYALSQNEINKLVRTN